MPDAPKPPTEAPPTSKPVLDATTDLLLAASELVKSLRSRAEQHAKHAKPRASKKAAPSKKAEPAAPHADGAAHRLRARLERTWRALTGPDEVEAPSAPPAAKRRARKRR